VPATTCLSCARSWCSWPIVAASVFTEATLIFREHTMRTTFAELRSELNDFNRHADHVHLSSPTLPTLAISALV
jgi:hypothetical protein